jgi:hypothetical protein
MGPREIAALVAMVPTVGAVLWVFEAGRRNGFSLAATSLGALALAFAVWLVTFFAALIILEGVMA